MDAPGNDGNASMPEQVKRPNPWRKMTTMMMMMIIIIIIMRINAKQNDSDIPTNRRVNTAVTVCMSV